MNDREHEIIGSIYDAAIDVSLWPQVIEKIVKYTNSKTAIFTALDQFSPSYDFLYSHNIPDEALEAYCDERIRVIDMQLHRTLWKESDVGETASLDLSHYADDPDSDKYIFYQRCLNPTGISYISAVLLDQGSHRWAVLGLHRAPEAPPYQQKELDFLKYLGVHLRRALQIHRQISLVQQDNLGLYHLLDHLKTGIILLDHNLRLNYCNPLAQRMMEQGSCLDLDLHNRLKTNIGDQSRLDQLLSSALLGRSVTNTDVGGVLALSDQKGRQLMLTVVPFSHLKNVQQQDVGQHHVAVLMTDKNQHYTLSKAYLQQSYQLSKREFELCELLVNGYKLEEIAEHCGITLSSVRTYFKNIYEKTSCTSQIELMHLLMGCTIHFEHIK
ncbi:helix-turn-helix transcriptional regulator [Acinetobacter towneri]|uniref:helix-turn-helix transcriptional regulator n=1 Tax=Acinetobacter towneri TaxID=202956 RepID=UPI001889F95E|nr:LuxR C-terminal-related transcriptional regulator [Acinetobacter towneri]MBF4521422.1 helix-turn-helix transcriptional regulator [Acinetobacter towneri]